MRGWLPEAAGSIQGFEVIGAWPQDQPPPGRQPAGYKRRSIARSSTSRGKIRGSDDSKSSGRHGAGRPHMSAEKFALCGNPMAWPISCAMTFLATLGRLSGGTIAGRMPTVRVRRSSKGPAWETNAVSPRMMRRSPGKSFNAGGMFEPCAEPRRTKRLCSRRAESGGRRIKRCGWPSRNAEPAASSWWFQYATASSTRSRRASSGEDAMATTRGLCCQGASNCAPAARSAVMRHNNTRSSEVRGRDRRQKARATRVMAPMYLTGEATS